MATPNDYLELEKKIEEQKRTIKRLTQERLDYERSWKVAKDRFRRPSFYKMLSVYKDYVTLNGWDENSCSATAGLTNKLRNYLFASSHGVRIPTLYQMASEMSEIEFDNLPDRFVVKTSGGSTSHGVLPIVRNGDRFEIADGTRVLTQEELVKSFEESQSKGLAYGEIFVEEFLTGYGSDNPIPDDVKIYCSYGEVMHILLRSVDLHGSVEGTRSKYIDAEGNDFGPVSSERNIDQRIRVPDQLENLTSIAKHLSLASGLSFCRIDLYDTPNGLYFGELTRVPGGAQTYSKQHDQMLAEKWLRGEARLQKDLKNGRPSGVLWGDKINYKDMTVLDNLKEEILRSSFVQCGVWCSD
ncbi:ATP-grasp fold amidoligase family protein [Corynebacterium cystitidis]|uniref:ATP-grasp fold amidoligase family protein n=1 Tax=Corynebacterium cystitidis TaxID=35757 RepID=UPI00211DE33A|nr:ATP-grasp fold amidoligase family protein [Corynebacterium cystitidis]